MKRDDPRTLMIKMDARLTFAGRERNHAFRMEEERELRHLDYARHLTRSTLERQQKEMHKRMDFLKTLVEENRLRRRQMEEEDRDKLKDDVDDGVLAEKRKRKEISLRHTLPVMPVRRNLEDLVSSLQRKQTSVASMSRSLGYLSESFSQHKTKDSLSEKRLRQLRQEMRDARKKEVPVPKVQIISEEDSPHSESPKVVWARKDGATNGAGKTDSKDGVSKQTILLPEISGGTRKPKAVGPSGRRVSLSQLIASGEITRLPGINPAGSTVTSGAPQNLNLARTFYMNTSQMAGRGPVFQPESGQKQENGSSRRGWVKLPPNTVPLKFLQEDLKQNPFMSSDFKPDTTRPRELLDSKKPEEMYVWLGFDSEEEYLQMVQQAKEEVDAEDDDDDDDLIELEVIDEVGEENLADGGIEKEGAEYLKKRRMSRRVSRLSAPVAMIASSLSGGLMGGKKEKPTSALRKFIKAAKTICVVRQFQLNSEEEPEKTWHTDVTHLRE